MQYCVEVEKKRVIVCSKRAQRTWNQRGLGITEVASVREPIQEVSRGVEKNEAPVKAEERENVGEGTVIRTWNQVGLLEVAVAIANVASAREIRRRHLRQEGGNQTEGARRAQGQRCEPVPVQEKGEQTTELEHEVNLAACATLNPEIKFYDRELVNVAPEGNECIMYFARELHLVKEAWSMNFPPLFASYNGHIKGGPELFRWKLSLIHRMGRGGSCQLHIFDDPMKSPAGIGINRFRQIGVLLQFFRANEGNSTMILVHEEPVHLATLELAPFSRDPLKPVSVMFENILPVEKLQEGLNKYNNSIFMRIYVKLMKGGVNVQHGIQKCFHPDTALFDLKEKMEKMLVEAKDADLTIVSSDGKGYKAHKAILAVNSDFCKAMFSSDMKEANGKQLNFDFKGEVLEIFLKFIYGRNRVDLELVPEVTVDVFRAADRYHIPLLKEACVESLLAMPIDKFTMDGALYVFYYGTTLGSLPLQTKSVQMIIGLGGKLTESKAYKDMIRADAEVFTMLTEMIYQFKESYTPAT